MSISTILGAAIPGTQISAGAILTTMVVGTVSGIATGIGLYVGIKLAAGAEEKAMQIRDEKENEAETANDQVKKAKTVLDNMKDAVTTEEVES